MKKSFKSKVFNNIAVMFFFSLILFSCFSTFSQVSLISIKAQNIPKPSICPDGTNGSNGTNSGCGGYPENVCSTNVLGGSETQTGSQTNACTNRNITNNGTFKEQVKEIVTNLNKFLISIVPFVAILAIIIGAYAILFKGLQVGIVIVQWGLIGLVVVVLAYAIFNVVARLLGFL
jgi:hypothetical protein